MYAGRMDTRVTVQRPETTRDEFGGVVEGWALIASTWAAVEPLTGRELFAAQATQTETTYRLTVRYMAGVDASCRVLLDDGRVLGITAVIDLRNQHRYVQFLCRELA
ncbi:phage head closure protein [Thauera sp.]|uniref:phage head closure protein n=1 Tax=Thauera sp. TaxID=1905334 RepID=UPI002B784A74|nr:phage head closure protein [Thauera sp.]HRP23615.1 phage head closure protein [Thauera sp.]